MEGEKLTFEAIGTRWEILLGQEIAVRKKSGLLKQIRARAGAFDKNYSRFRADSLVAAISTKAGSYALPKDGFVMLQFYERLYHATDGLVTPLIGQVMADAGYDADYSFRPGELKRVPKWEDVITYDQGHIEVSEPVLLDFGAAGKGYLVDQIGELIHDAGITAFVINAGGDILHRADGGDGMDVGLENPLDSSEVVGIASICNQSLCASSGSKRKWQNFHHIINPATLKPTEQIIATWALADSAMTSDGLATALFFVAPERLRDDFSFAYAVLSKDMDMSYSKHFPLKLFEAVDAQH